MSLRAGTTILEAVLGPYGFLASPIKSGHGSGGWSASCEFRKDNRRLQLHFRLSLGLVEYQVGAVTLSHEDYMWSVCGRRWVTEYPGFSEEPLDGFRHVAADLTRFGQDFLTGSEDDFAEHAARVATFKARAPRLPQ